MRSPHQQHRPDAQTSHHSPGRSPHGPRIAVIGGSLTGPATALLLAQAGFADVTLYEAMPASTTLGGA